MNPIYLQLLLGLIQAIELLSAGKTEEAAELTKRIREATDQAMKDAEAHGM